LQLGIHISGTRVSTSHHVDPSEYEPDLPPELQPDEHALEMGLATATLQAALGVSTRVAVELAVPLRVLLADATFERDGARIDVDSIHHRDELRVGLGDVQLGAAVNLLPPAAKGLWLTVRPGVTLPTGETVPDPHELGARGERHDHVAFGSGTVDPALGLAAGYDLSAVALVAWVDGRGGLYENEHGHLRGVAVSGALGADSALGTRHWRFRAELGALHETPSTWDGEAAENSGRTDLRPGVSVVWRFTPTWMTRLAAQRPITLRARGGQLEIPVVLQLGVESTLKVF
jgi:hypothetical protein